MHLKMSSVKMTAISSRGYELNLLDIGCQWGIEYTYASESQQKISSLTVVRHLSDTIWLDDGGDSISHKQGLTLEYHLCL